jgi:hypothetical protein
MYSCVYNVSEVFVLLSTQERVFLPLVEQLTSIVEVEVLDHTDSEEKVISGQTALLSLKLLCRHLGSKNPQTFSKVRRLAGSLNPVGAGACVRACVCV